MFLLVYCIVLIIQYLYSKIYQGFVTRRLLFVFFNLSHKNVVPNWIHVLENNNNADRRRKEGDDIFFNVEFKKI